MKWNIVTSAPGAVAAEALIVITDEKKKFAALKGTSLDAAPAAFQDDVATGRVKTTLALPLEKAKASRLILTSVGLEKSYHPWAERVKMAAARALDVCRSLSISKAAFVLNGAQGADAVAAVAEGAILGAYKYEEFLNSPENFADKLECTIVVAKPAAKRAGRDLEHARIVADAANYARDLVNRPFPDKNPQVLADEARQIAAEFGLECEVLDKAALTAAKFNCLLGVGQGSREHPPVMITLRYRPKKKSGAKASRLNLGLVGKAITFDTGGISIKPSSKMWEMKGDMAGGAAVLGAMRAIAQLKPDVRVTAIVPSAHNAVGDTALHPGQILRHRGGKSVHIDNTDAEGRLILIDAFERAKEERVTHMVDLATLTGACVRAIGESMCGAFTTDEKWLGAIRAAGDAAGEMIWPLPLHQEYIAMMHHHAADINNASNSVNAGAITAALFLKEFVPEKLPWVHLDIAGPFLRTSAWKYYKEGGTGFGVKTLVKMVESAAKKGV